MSSNTQSRLRLNPSVFDARTSILNLKFQEPPHKTNKWITDVPKNKNDKLNYNAQIWLELEHLVSKSDTTRADLVWPATTTKEPRPHTTSMDLNPQLLINTATNLNEIVELIKLYGLDTIADRILYLHKMMESDSDQIDFDFDSLRNLALFFINESQLPTPQIVVDEDGLGHAEWQIQDHGILVMVFLPSNMIKFVGICQPYKNSQSEWDVSGTLPPDQILKAIKPFLNMDLTN